MQKCNISATSVRLAKNVSKNIQVETILGDNDTMHHLVCYDEYFALQSTFYRPLYTIVGK